MTKKAAPGPRRRFPEHVIDPYVVVDHTWTRSELLKARGMTAKRRRPAKSRPADALRAA